MAGREAPLPGVVARQTDQMQELTDTVRRLVRTVQPPPGMATCLIAVDGYGGAGKSTLARLIAATYDATVVHTDDFASWDNPIDWWPRLLDQILRPLGRNEQARYQRFDWVSGQLAEWHDLPPGGLVLIEGVTSSRAEFRPYLAGSIWLETPAEVRLRRGLERDGEQARGQWLEWMAAERRWGAAHQPWADADLVLPGH